MQKRFYEIQINFFLLTAFLGRCALSNRKTSKKGNYNSLFNQQQVCLQNVTLFMEHFPLSVFEYFIRTRYYSVGAVAKSVVDNDQAVHQLVSCSISF